MGVHLVGERAEGGGLGREGFEEGSVLSGGMDVHWLVLVGWLCFGFERFRGG